MIMWISVISLLELYFDRFTYSDVSYITQVELWELELKISRKYEYSNRFIISVINDIANLLFLSHHYKKS